MDIEDQREGTFQIPLLYCDLDGTVRHGFDELGRFVNTEADVIVFPEAVVQMRRWKELGGRIIGVTNQGGIALGHLSEEDCAKAIRATYELSDGLFDMIAFCPHYPTAEGPENRCWCRKPRPGLVIEATYRLEEAYPDERYPRDLALFVGDREEDRACAEACNVSFCWAADWRAGNYTLVRYW